MSAVPAPVRTPDIAPPGYVAPPVDEGARARLREGARRVFVTLFAAGAALPPVAVLFGPAAGDDLIVVTMVFCYLMLVFPAGFALLIYAAVRRRARELRTLVGAVLALAGSVLLLPRAGLVAREASLDRHAARLEALAAELRTAPEGVLVQVAQRPWTYGPGVGTSDAEWVTVERMRKVLRDAGFSVVRMEREGYTVFHSSAAFAPHAVYVEGAATPAPADLCDGARPRFAGGRWWLYRCAPVDF